MRNFTKRLALLALALLLAASTAMAYDFEVDGIYYKKVRDLEISVTFKDDTYNSYSGAVTIPSTVTYEGKTYTVIYIDWCAFFALILPEYYNGVLGTPATMPFK
jgi:hypothetical protein